MVRHVKFSVAIGATLKDLSAEFDLKRQVAESFECVRSVETSEIRTLKVQQGLPFSMEIEHESSPSGRCHHA
jgi:hypothetical protein